MANADVRGGLMPVRTLSGRPYNGSVNIYAIAAGNGTATFLGDLVKLAGTAEVVNGRTYVDVVQAATGDVIVGAVVAFLPDTRDSLIYRAASTLRLVAVCDDPDMLFECQEVTGGTTLVANDLGLNVNFIVGTGDTVTGRSKFEIDNSTEATTNTLDLQLVGVANREDNDATTASSGNIKWLVRINRSRYANQVAGT